MPNPIGDPRPQTLLVVYFAMYAYHSPIPGRITNILKWATNRNCKPIRVTSVLGQKRAEGASASF